MELLCVRKKDKVLFYVFFLSGVPSITNDIVNPHN